MSFYLEAVVCGEELSHGAELDCVWVFRVQGSGRVPYHGPRGHHLGYNFSELEL